MIKEVNSIFLSIYYTLELVVFWFSYTMNWITPTSQALGLLAQHKLLSHFVRTPFEAKATHTLNYVEFKLNEGKKFPEERVLVLMHGYASGLGMFFDNYDALAKHFDRVIAVDWLGMGLSNRSVKPVTRTSMYDMFCKQNKEEVLKVSRKVTDEFVDSLEELRVSANLPKFVLAGHSLGGYLSSRYALKYPHAVEALVLISPAGIQSQPDAKDVVEASQLGWKLRLVDNMWKLNFTPQNIVRILGPRGPGVVTNMINRRFSFRWGGDELTVISDYLYHISAAPGNGEYALNALLEPKFVKPPSIQEEAEVTATAAVGTGKAVVTKRQKTGVYAREPLEADLCQLKVPVLMMFGDNDWLAYPTAQESVSKWRQHGVKADLAVIGNAGHHLYTDNSVDFNRTVVDWVQRSAYLTSDSNVKVVSAAARVARKKTNLVDAVFE